MPTYIENTNINSNISTCVIILLMVTMIMIKQMIFRKDINQHVDFIFIIIVIQYYAIHVYMFL